MYQFSEWYYQFMPRYIIRLARGVLWHVYRFIAPSILLQTFFWPWKRDLQTTDNLPLHQRLGVWVENLMSRLIGAAIRGATLVGGVLFLLLGVLVGVVSFLMWFVLPFVAIFLIGFGLRTLFGLVGGA